MWSNWNPRALLVELENGAVACKTVWQLLKKSNIELLYDSLIPLLSMYPKEVKAGNRTDICISTAALFTAAKRWEKIQVSLLHKWIL